MQSFWAVFSLQYQGFSRCWCGTWLAMYETT